jgi:hypothetical protein
LVIIDVIVIILKGRWEQKGHSCLKSGVNDAEDKTEKNLSFKKVVDFC